MVGGVAAVLHGVPRATFDLDVLVEATVENVERLLAALLEEGFGTAALTTSAEILAHEITVFNDRVRIDVFTSVPGLTFEDAWKSREEMDYHGTKLFVASRSALIAAKRASGRTRDLEDLAVLEQGE